VAYVNMAHVLSVRRRAEALDNIYKALEIGERLGRSDVVSLALTAKGIVLIDGGQDGLSFIEQALQLALAAEAEPQVCEAYGWLADNCVNLQRLDEAEKYFLAGMALGERRELRMYTRCMRGSYADVLLLRGRWDEAERICVELLALPAISPWNLLYPLRILGTIRGRRGEPRHLELLNRSAALATATETPKWVAQVRAVKAELLWLSNNPDLALQEAQEAYGDALGKADMWKLASLAIWLWRLGAGGSLPGDLPEPYALEIAGQWRDAADAWERLGRTYDAALIRIIHSTDEFELREILAFLDDLGARAPAAAVRRRMRELGITSIPRGPRPSTIAAPAGLTAREQEVLALLSQGLADKEISRRLFISERTVQHHVSSVFSKIGVSTRLAAAGEAARLGIASEMST
jgi:DNA-binding CsgD family transcriptional regulator